jgi:acyl-CoA thioesterase
VTDTAPHPFDVATRLQANSDGVLRGATSEAYWNFTGPFGGTTAATLLRAVLEHEKRAGDPVSITVNFCAPIARGDFQIALREIRTNRSTQHWYAELSQPEVGIAANATIACAARRETWAHQPARPPPAPAPEMLAALPTQGMMAWLQRYEFRFVHNQPKRFAATPNPQPDSALSHLWLSDAPPRPLDFLSLTALADTFFARIFHVRGALVPIGTVSMTTYFHADAAGLSAVGSAPLLGVSDAKVFNKGYADQTVELWSRDGSLLATSTQIVYFRDPAG